MMRPHIPYQFTHRADPALSDDLDKAEIAAMARASKEGYDALYPRAFRTPNGIQVNVYLRKPIEAIREGNEDFEGFIRIPHPECKGQDKARHRLSIFFPGGSERIVLETPTGVFPGSSYAPATQKALGQIALSLGVKFVWRHVDD